MTKDVINYYLSHYNEVSRHSDPFGIIQETRTKELISRYLLHNGMSILDVGGANGIYSFFLADLGHKVSLLDIAPNHIEQAIEIDSKRTKKLHHIILGDVQTFDSKDEYDIIILHGPLYHIVEREKRINVLRKMKNILAPNGSILGFAINRYAGYFYGVRTGAILDEEYRKSIQKETKTGIRQKTPGWYFHKPIEIKQEYKEAGLKITSLKSVATQIWMLPNIDTKIRNPDEMKIILDLAKEGEDHVEIGQDILCVGKNT
jgi:2-polyprenyl-3-methyl-5-hydroxy-6-metoxy-1,4-benzoquinol methylase